MDLQLQIQEVRALICNEIGEKLFPYNSDFSLKSQKHYDDFKAAYPNHYAQITMILAEYQKTLQCPTCNED